MKTMTQPHTCPVCSGNGLVPNGFYRQTSGNWSTSDATPEECRSCQGTGIVWSMAPEETILFERKSLSLSLTIPEI